MKHFRMLSIKCFHCFLWGWKRHCIGQVFKQLLGKWRIGVGQKSGRSDIRRVKGIFVLVKKRLLWPFFFFGWTSYILKWAMLGDHISIGCTVSKCMLFPFWSKSKQRWFGSLIYFKKNYTRENCNTSMEKPTMNEDTDILISFNISYYLKLPNPLIMLV